MTKKESNPDAPNRRPTAPPPPPRVGGLLPPSKEEIAGMTHKEFELTMLLEMERQHTDFLYRQNRDTWRFASVMAVAFVVMFVIYIIEVNV